MGVYSRPDSPFLWLLLERNGQKPIREATELPKDGGSPAQNRELRRQAQEVYSNRMIALARRRHKLPTDLDARSFKDHRAWYATHVSSKKRSAGKEAYSLRTLGTFFDAYALDAIDQALVREWRTWRLAKVSASTVHREETTLKHMLTTAVPKYLEVNPLAKFRSLRIAQTDTRVLTLEEERRLLKALEPLPEARALVIGAMDTLLRMRNIADLSRKQDHGTYLYADTKVGAVRIPISTRFRTALDALPEGGPVYFPRYAHRENTNIIVMFKKACVDGKVQTGRKTGGVSFHCLRHTGATRMLAAGVDVKTVMEIGGWLNLKVLARYLHPTDERKQAAVNLIGGST